jgi:hypothetical protein
MCVTKTDFAATLCSELREDSRHETLTICMYMYVWSPAPTHRLWWCTPCIDLPRSNVSIAAARGLTTMSHTQSDDGIWTGGLRTHCDTRQIAILGVINPQGKADLTVGQQHHATSTQVRRHLCIGICARMRLSGGMRLGRAACMQINWVRADGWHRALIDRASGNCRQYASRQCCRRNASRQRGMLGNEMKWPPKTNTVVRGLWALHGWNKLNAGFGPSTGHGTTWGYGTWNDDRQGRRV